MAKPIDNYVESVFCGIIGSQLKYDKYLYSFNESFIDYNIIMRS